MDWLMMIASSQGVQLSLSGALGGLARWLMVIVMDKKMATKQGLATVALGALVGAYVTPQAGHTIAAAFEFIFRSPMDPEKAPFFNAFLLGILGVAAVGFAIDAFSFWTKKKLAGDDNVPDSPKPADGGS